MQNFISREWKQRFPREYLALKLKISQKSYEIFSEISFDKLREMKYFVTIKKLQLIYNRSKGASYWVFKNVEMLLGSTKQTGSQAALQTTCREVRSGQTAAIWPRSGAT
jgi:hypothetical protein